MHLIEAAQWIWRLLPSEFRVTMGRPLRSITEPLLALRIPPAGEFSRTPPGHLAHVIGAT
jgi:hypothetical protein